MNSARFLSLFQMVQTSIGGLLALSVGLSACGESSTANPVAVSEYPQAAAVATCERLSRCEPDPLQLQWIGVAVGADLDACIDFLGDFSAETDVAAWVAAGAVRYDAAAAGECLASFASDCKDLPTNLVICDEAVVGLVAPGGTCDDDIVCAGDAFCDRGDNLEACDGVCTLRVAPGEPCERREQCSTTEGPSWCDGQVDVCVLLKPIVETVVGAGEACGVEIEPTEERHANCRAGFACVWDTDADKEVCAPIFKDGEDCSGVGACNITSICVRDADKAICQPIAVAVSAGAPCNAADETRPLIMCNPFGRLQCGDEGTCQHFPGDLGSGCNNMVPCKTGLRCSDWDGGECLALKADGETCQSEEECASGYCDAQMCAPLVCE